TIHYEAVDPGGKPGHFLYLKPTFYKKNEPRDVYNYALTSDTFPHETTGDQWFSESQFESYRALGEYVMGIAGKSNMPLKDICALMKQAAENLDPTLVVEG